MILHKDVETHVRRSAIRVVEHAVLHARCCDGAGCQIPLASRQPRLLGVCIVQAVLERLAARGGEGLASLSSEFTLAELDQSIQRVKQLQIVPSSLNGGARTTCIAAVSIALGWTSQVAKRPCAPVIPFAQVRLRESPAPAALSNVPSPMAPLPPPMAPLAPPNALDVAVAVAAAPTSATSSPVQVVNPHVYAVRDRILGASRVAQVPDAVRRAALAAIQTPKVIEWIEGEAGMHTDVLGVIVLIAVAAKIDGAGAGTEAGGEAPLPSGALTTHAHALHEVRRSVCYHQSISPTTAAAAETRLVPLLPEAACACACARACAAADAADAAADGIF
jgi:hypothetical protein